MMLCTLIHRTNATPIKLFASYHQGKDLCREICPARSNRGCRENACVFPTVHHGRWPCVALSCFHLQRQMASILRMRSVALNIDCLRLTMSGYHNDPSFLLGLRHLVFYLDREYGLERDIIVIYLDQLGNGLTMEVSEFYRRNKILLLFLPS